MLSENLEFCKLLWSKYPDEAERWGHTVADGDQAAWGGVMICAPTDAEANAWAEDMLWFWDKWAVPFGNPRPKLLIGSPDTISAMIEEAASTFAVTTRSCSCPRASTTARRC